jgi:Resolvase, N terminal domain
VPQLRRRAFCADVISNFCKPAVYRIFESQWLARQLQTKTLASPPRVTTRRSGSAKGRLPIQQRETCGVDLYLDQQAIDTTTPTGRLMFQITGAFAEFERSMIRQRIRAGLRRTVEAGKQLGRPNIDLALEKRIQSQLRAGKGMLAIARECKVGTGTVQRVAREIRRPFGGANVVA